METVKFVIRKKGDLAKSIIQILREMAERHDFIEEEGKKPNTTTRKALEDDKLYTAKSVSDLFDSI